MHRLIRREGEKVDQDVLHHLDEAKQQIRKHDEAGAPDRTAKEIAVASQNFISIDKVFADLQKKALRYTGTKPGGTSTIGYSSTNSWRMSW